MDYRFQGDAELYFQNTMYVMLKLMGQQVQVERHTSNGRKIFKIGASFSTATRRLENWTMQESCTSSLN